jgi:hypothetical protein
MMEEVCVIVDAQGFVSNGKFIVREIAFKNDEFELCKAVETNLDLKDMSIMERCTNEHATRFVHGLSLRPSGNEKISQDEVVPLIRQVYFHYKTDRKAYIGIKNNQLRDILRSSRLKYYEFHEPSIASLKIFYGHDLCPQHAGGDFTCAQTKCKHLYKWVEEFIWAKNLIREGQVSLDVVD